MRYIISGMDPDLILIGEPVLERLGTEPIKHLNLLEPNTSLSFDDEMEDEEEDDELEDEFDMKELQL